MPGFRNVRAVVDTEIAGGRTLFGFRKVPAQTTGAGIWFDMSMSPGVPTPNYYIGAQNTFVPLTYSTDNGINVGGAVSPLQKHLRRVLVMNVGTGTPMRMILLDYIGFYGFIDEGMSSTVLVNTARTAATRHYDGEGVQMMPVVVAGHSGAQVDKFNVTYTNSAGVEGRVSANMPFTAQLVNGTILSSGANIASNCSPFISLMAGDRGVIKAEAVTINGTEDYGLFALVLVKPLASLIVRGVDAATEVDFLKDFAIMPRIHDHAYLNWTVCPGATLSGQPTWGLLETVWA